MRSIVVIFFLCYSGVSLANDTVKVKIPLVRQHFHEKIDEEQKMVERLDGKADSLFRISNNDEINWVATDVLFRAVDDMQYWVELNVKLASNNEKVRYLRYIQDVLSRYRIAYRHKEIKPAQLPELLDIFEKMMKAQDAGEPIAPFVGASTFQVAKICTDVFSDSRELQEMKNHVYLKYCAIYPEKIMQTIGPFADQSFADSLIIISCRLNPVQLYSYAQSSESIEGKLIHRNKDPLVMTVADISQTPNALFYFPFLDDIISGKKTMEDIHRFVGDGDAGYDSVGYYSLLVKTNIDYFTRMSPPLRDTPIAMLGPNGLREMLRSKAVRHFITPINELHNQPNLAIRMKALDPLSAEELYYMMVAGENDIYTSSFKHSFNRMLQKMGNPPRGDSLLQNVHFDYFRKFIKMAAGYNKLDTFLKTMPQAKSLVLMKAFVSNLDKSDNIEDAVDVADAYSSITDPKLLNLILEYVQKNYERSVAEQNEKGERIYGLLKLIFKMSGNPSQSDSALGIPSVYYVNRSDLMDDSGRIVQQVFFYGDEDGQKIFQPFLNSFSPKEWSVNLKKEWVEIKSLKGKVWIFANRPLDYDANLDDSAQMHLGSYLDENNLYPTVVVHRGHSYWLQSTISRMPLNAKIVVVGSCGGYKNLSEILGICPEASIISTKEIGTGEINRPILNYLNQSFLKEKTIVWKNMWTSLSAAFSRDADKSLYESWQNYVPPYRNLGAIFIKAYNKQEESR